LESELFGHEKGAFTDARRDKPGRFELANGGTIFLDEITETSSKSQIDLLRVLEQREICRLGSESVVPVDVRIVSATNKDIEELVDRGDFREDLYYRLNVVPIRMPPLRERKDDIPLLVDHYMRHFCERHRRQHKQLATEAMRALVSHSWPGNIRQLRNFVERLVVTVSGDIVHAEDLPMENRETPVRSALTLADSVEEAEKQAILAALATCDYHREKTARLLDISVRTLHYKMSRYDLH
jgi:two-component system NtrC family response regulator